MESTSTAVMAAQFVIQATTLIVYVLPLIIIFAILVKKANKPAWSQIIPAFNSYIIGIVAKKPKLAIAAPVLYIATVAANYATLNGLTAILSIVWMVVSLIILSAFIKQYDAGLGKWILFVFFPLIGVFFASKTQYIGGPIALPVAPLAPTPPVSPPTLQ